MSNFTVDKQINGMKIVSFSNDRKDSVFDDIDKFINSMPIDTFAKRTLSLDSLNVNSSGTVSINGKEDLKLSSVAFDSLMNYLSIPLKFINRTPIELTITIINRFLSDSLVACDFSIGDGIVSTIGKTSTLTNMPGGKTVFQEIVSDNSDLSFCFGIREGNTIIGVFAIGDIESYENKPIPAIEVMYSEDMSSYPSVAGMMLTTEGHAQFSHLKSSSNPKDIGNGNVVESIKSSVYEIKSKLADDVTKAYATLGDAMKKETWRAAILAGHSVFGKSKFNLLIKDEEKTIKRLFDKVSSIKDSGKFTLEEKRQHALYLGELFSPLFN